MSKFNIGDKVMAKNSSFFGEEVGILVGIDTREDVCGGRYLVKFNSLNKSEGWEYKVSCNNLNPIIEPYEGYAVWLDNLIKVKNRPISKSFPIMCANIEQIKNIAIVTEREEKLIKAFMPGPITLVLRKKEGLPEYITNGWDTIAVRMATSKVLEELIKKTGSPLFMTSANKSGKPECTNLDDIENIFKSF